MTIYSVNLNDVTNTLAGEINEVYAYIVDKILMLYIGKKVGDLVLTWISQEQGDVQLVGYVEGPPPCPMANLTNQSSYNGATSVTLSIPRSLSFHYSKDTETSNDLQFDTSINFTDVEETVNDVIAPLGIGVMISGGLDLDFSLGGKFGANIHSGAEEQTTPNFEFDESIEYTVRLQGTPPLRSGDTFMSRLNTMNGKAILPNPKTGGFTQSSLPAQLPGVLPTDEKFGSPMFIPSPYGQAFVTSRTLDVYQQTLLQTNTVFGFVRIPNAQIPRDINTVSFRMSSKYVRPGCLDGVIGYVYQPSTLPDGTRTYNKSTGQMQILNDKNFKPGAIGHDASYMKVVEAYQLKKQIDQESSNALALFQTAWSPEPNPLFPFLKPPPQDPPTVSPIDNRTH